MKRNSNECGEGDSGWQAEPFGERLLGVIARLPPGDVTVAEIRDLVGPDGLLLLTVLLTLVFMVPVSIPGVSTVFGGAILLIGVSRLLNRTLWMPKRIAQHALPSDKIRDGLGKGSKWLHRLERVCRPHRLNGVAANGLATLLSNGGLVLGAVLLMAPFGLIPFSNTLPALALLFLSLGLLQRDGLFILLGHVSNLATILYFGVLVFFGIEAVREAFRHLMERLS